MTTTLFNIIQSELIKKGLNEFVNENGELVFFERENQFTRKILMFDTDVKEVVNDLLQGVNLNNAIHDENFKKAFIYRFLNRQINRQTVEAFQFELLATFLSKQDYINTVYEDIEKYITQENSSNQENNQINKQISENTNVSDNRSAYANLPQSNLNLDFNNSIIETADDNTVSRNKQTSNQVNDTNVEGSNITQSKQYQLDELMKASGLITSILDEFDKKCFMQIF